MTVVDGLQEIDRPVLPIMSPSEHERVNARLFSEFDQRVIGRESAREAQERFAAAMRSELDRTDTGNLIVVTHGTVMSLFVSQHNNLDPFQLWKRLECTSFIVLEQRSYRLIEVVPADAGGTFQKGNAKDSSRCTAR
jgi:broad specificity phosphatase PhoE